MVRTKDLTKDLTVEDIAELLYTRQKHNALHGLRVEQKIAEMTGNLPKQEDHRAIAIRDRLNREIANKMALRLKRNRRSTPLFSSRDIDRLIPYITRELFEGKELDSEEKRILETLIRSFMKGVFGLAVVAAKDSDSYETNWRWIRTVLEFSEETGLVPQEFLARSDARDEIMRRLYTRHEYRAMFTRDASTLVSVRALKKVIVEPTLDAVAQSENFSSEERRELKKELEGEIMPEVRMRVAESREALRRVLAEDIARIYGKRR